MRILIAGCGDLGTRLGQNLAAAGHTVWGLRRSHRPLPAPLHPLNADLACVDALAATLPADLDAVVFAAAPAGDDDAYRRCYGDGVANLLRVLADRPQPPQRWLLCSSSAVYGDRDGAWTDETSPVDGSTPRTACLLAAEALWAQAPGVAVVARLSGLYGPGRTWLIDALRRGTARCRRQPPIYTNRIHRDDAAAALQHLLGQAQPAPCYLLTDHTPSPLHEVFDWLARHAGLPPASEVDDASAATLARGSKRLRNTLLCSTGLVLSHPDYRSGYAAMLHEMGLWQTGNLG